MIFLSLSIFLGIRIDVRPDTRERRRVKINTSYDSCAPRVVDQQYNTQKIKRTEDNDRNKTSKREERFFFLPFEKRCQNQNNLSEIKSQPLNNFISLFEPQNNAKYPLEQHGRFLPQEHIVAYQQEIGQILVQGIADKPGEE